MKHIGIRGLALALLLMLLTNGCATPRWLSNTWPFKRKVESNYKERTFDMDHQPGMPKETVKPTPKKEDTVSVFLFCLQVFFPL